MVSTVIRVPFSWSSDYLCFVAFTNWSWIGRSFFGGALYIIIAMLLELPDRLTKTTAGTFYIIISAVVITQFLLFAFTLGVNGIVHSYRNIKVQYSYVEDKQGNINPMIADFTTYADTTYPAYSSALSHVGSSNIDAQVNRSNAKYFGLETIRSVSENDWNTIYKNGGPALMNIWNFQDM